MKRPAQLLKLCSVFIAGLAGLGSCSTPDEPEAGACADLTAKSRFGTGSDAGHADPAGARAAGQARAGRIGDAGLIRQPDSARSRVRLGDYLLINDKLAFYIEGARPSDGYSSLGGELLAVDRVGDDGRPAGVSQYGETLFVLSRQAVNAESVTVLNDGADGKAAVIRVSGQLTNIPFLDTFSGLLPKEYDFPAALDYVLEPGAEKLSLRLSLMNTTDSEASFAGAQGLGFFQYARSRVFTDGKGYAEPVGYSPWVGWDTGDLGFAFRVPQSTLRFIVSASGFYFFQPAGGAIAACETKTLDYAEIIAGGPGLDGLRAAIRRTDGDASWRQVTGRVTDTDGRPLAGARVHLLQQGGLRTAADTGGDGTYALHAPPGDSGLQVTLPGYTTPEPVALPGGAAALDLKLQSPGTISVRATEMGNGQAIPVRVQVIPEVPPPVLPDWLGVRTEAQGRLHQIFAVTGAATAAVPAGRHRVVVSRGYEWEIFDQTVTVTPGKTTTVEAQLQHSVDSTGVQCADFHIHSHYSADSRDPVDFKVRGAIADGLDIPVSSEHEWIIDFQPTIQALGLQRWAFGFPSEEFTTFTWGHFGIIPKLPHPDQLNNGAIPWIGRKPDEVFKEIGALPERPVLIVNHPSGGGFGAYFSSVHFDRAMAQGDPDMWSDRFQAVEVFNDSDLESNRDKSVADWFALLNAGKIVWAVGNSDSHDLRTNPVGYPRTCLQLGHDDPQRLRAEDVRDALGRGAAVVSGGLYMTVEGPGGAGPGSMLPAAPGGREFKVTVQAPRWLEATTLEVIVDGETTQTVQLRESGGGGARRYESQVMVTAPRPRPLHWVVFHASAGQRDLAPLSPGRRPFAVSNPVLF